MVTKQALFKVTVLHQWAWNRTSLLTSMARK